MRMLFRYDIEAVLRLIAIENEGQYSPWRHVGFEGHFYLKAIHSKVRFSYLVVIHFVVFGNMLVSSKHAKSGEMK